MKYSRDFFKKHIDNTLESTDIKTGTKISGKVRDSYVTGKYRILVATDRLSAFDRIITTVPFKGEILTGLSLFWFRKTEDIVPNHVVRALAKNAVAVKNCEIIPLEVIVRGYLTGSLWRSYKEGKVPVDIKLTAGLNEYYAFPEPLVCFTTKALQEDHDEPVGRDEILKRGILSEKELARISEIALKLYNRGNSIVGPNNLILVDTKYEFGRLDGDIVLADEIHTQDSSRYIMKDIFEKRSEVIGLDKEYFRKWLISQGYNGDGPPPFIPDEIIIELVMRYVDAYTKITGGVPELVPYQGEYNKELENTVTKFFKSLREG